MRKFSFVTWVLLGIFSSPSSNSAQQKRAEDGGMAALSVSASNLIKATPIGVSQENERRTVTPKIGSCPKEQRAPYASVRSSLGAVSRVSGNEDSNGFRGLEEARPHSGYLPKLYRKRGSVAYSKGSSSHRTWWAKSLSRILADAAHLASLIDSGKVERTEARTLFLFGFERPQKTVAGSTDTLAEKL